MFIVFCAPLSLNLEHLKDYGGIGLYFPTEPLLVVMLSLFLIIQTQKRLIDKSHIYHPVSIAIIFYLCWIGITCVTSTHQIVSFKYLVSKLWFIIPVYFLGLVILRKEINVKVFLWAYIIPLSGVVIYTIIRHSQFGFAEKPAHWVMNPFYKDHTSYGALLAIYIPICIAFFYNAKHKKIKALLGGLILLFIIAIVLSYTRAAWVSLFGALGVYALIKLRVKLTIIALFSLVLLSVFVFSFDRIMMNLEKNQSDSSTNISEHVESISNVTTDVSNLERINRWKSAWRMFLEKPITGWGPGTYAFEYAPFQHSDELTIISTNFGNAGNAHSEYLGPLAESGILGFVTLITVVLLTIRTGILLYYRLKRNDLKRIVLSLVLGYVTYFIHGTLNNYLDSDKASIPIWGITAIIVALDLKTKKELKDATAENSDVV